MQKKSEKEGSSSLKKRPKPVSQEHNNNSTLSKRIDGNDHRKRNDSEDLKNIESSTTKPLST